MPAEVWLEILASLGYWDLLSIGRVNRELRALVRHPALDFVALRRLPTKTGSRAPNGEAKRHPFLSSIVWLGPDDDGELAVQVRPRWGHPCRRGPLAQLPVAQELVVDRVTKSWLPVSYLGGGPEIRFGVVQTHTIGQALETIFNAVRTHAPDLAEKGLMVGSKSGGLRRGGSLDDQAIGWVRPVVRRTFWNQAQRLTLDW